MTCKYTRARANLRLAQACARKLFCCMYGIPNPGGVL